jgi:hypothetical protein
MRAGWQDAGGAREEVLDWISDFSPAIILPPDRPGCVSYRDPAWFVLRYVAGRDNILQKLLRFTSGIGSLLSAGVGAVSSCLTGPAERLGHVLGRAAAPLYRRYVV